MAADMAVVAAGMAAVIGMAGARIALLAAGMGVVVTGTAVAGMAAGIMVVTVAAGELDPQ
jgi:hypothetical protein